MKTSALFFLMLFLTSGLNAANKSNNCFVIIGDKTYYCDDVHVGKASTKIFTDGRKFIKVPTYKVSAYSQGGNFYESLPVLNKNQDTTGWAFMQFITSCDGNRLYRYCSNCLKYDPVNGIINPVIPVYRFYTFRNGKFVSVTDDQDVKEQLALLGIKVTV